MSGGALDYFFSAVRDHANDFADRELNDLVKDLSALWHDREWFLSGDTSEGFWNEALMAFKGKWFSHDGAKQRTEQYVKEAVNDLLLELGMPYEMCGNCKWFRREQEPYGQCVEPSEDRKWLEHRAEKACVLYERGTDGKEIQAG